MFNFFSEIRSKCKDVVSKVTTYQIVFVGDGLMYVDGRVVLMTLATENIVFKVDDGVITVSGKNLNIKEISESSLTITGKICSWEKI